MLTRSAPATKPFSYACFLLTLSMGLSAVAAPADVASNFTNDIRPLLVDRCYDCHGDGSKKGGVAFDDASSDAALVQNVELWSKALKAVRAGLMPPPKHDPLTADEIAKLEHWVKYDAFGLDRKLPDPGRVTVRRLNRVEYRNTIHDLLGVDYKADEEFPADDSGHGFDNIGDVLTVSPMLLEKYLDAASQIAADAVPDTSRVVADHLVTGKSFHRATPTTAPTTKPAKPSSDGSLSLSFYDPASASASVKLEQTGTYTVVVELVVKGKYAEKGFDHNRSEVAVSIDGAEVHRKEYGWDQKREVHLEFPESWQGGDEHHFEVSLKPLTHDLPHYGEIELQIVSLNVRGPQEREHWVRPKNYARFFGEGADDLKTADQRRDLARKLLRDFAGKAFRHPVDEPTVDRLVALAESIYGRGDKTFELGVRHAMVAVLASPRFIFREEASQPAATPDERYPLIDEYSLASRLSYFLWSSMPDDELLRLAAAGELRKHQAAQVKRMLADAKADALIKNFMGQWLQARDVDNIQIDFRRAGDFAAYKRFLSTDKDRGDTRRAMSEELQRYFAYVVHENRSILELVDSDYTFVNERLANYYGIPGVTGNDVRRVTLPKDSPRGGVLTSGGVMLVTSNPTRTSPVKRGLFVLENVLGTPIPPPPPDIPPLEDASKKFKGRTPTLRETLELHRSASACVSCHSRMDPLGLAFENFSPVGLWRDKDAGQPIDSTGKLITGEAFKDVRELKHILVTDRKADVYRCISEKLLTYALGRGLEYYDVETVDQIVDRLQKDDGRFDTLLAGVIESSAFQRRRANPDGGAGPRPVTATSSADGHHSPGTTR